LATSSSTFSTYVRDESVSSKVIDKTCPRDPPELTFPPPTRFGGSDTLITSMSGV
jgi:hypothetical protein